MHAYSQVMHFPETFKSLRFNFLLLPSHSLVLNTVYIKSMLLKSVPTAHAVIKLVLREKAIPYSSAITTKFKISNKQTIDILINLSSTKQRSNIPLCA